MVFRLNKKKDLCDIYLVDSHRSLVDSMKDRFKNSLKYALRSFSSHDSLLDELKQSILNKRTIVLVYVLRPGTSIDEVEYEVLDLLKDIKDINSEITPIIVADNLESDVVRRLSISPSYSFVQNNDNAMLKITNLILGTISKDNLERKFISARNSALMLLIFILAVLFLTIAFYFIKPQYF